MFLKMVGMTCLMAIFCVFSVFGEGGLDYFASHNASTTTYMRQVENGHLKSNHQNKNIYQLINSGDLQQALGELKYVLDRIPNHPLALQLMGTVTQLTKGTAVGVSYFDRAVNTFPEYALTRAQYGLFLVSIGNVDAGIEKLKQSIEIDPKLPAGYAGLAHAYAKKNDPIQAREAAEKARELGFKGQLPPGF